MLRSSRPCGFQLAVFTNLLNLGSDHYGDFDFLPRLFVLILIIGFIFDGYNGSCYTP
jgi:hypothetical protein